MKIKTGNVEAAKTIRAGCGMRYDPDQLGDQTGFDFPDADLWKALFPKESEEQSEPKKKLEKTKV